MSIRADARREDEIAYARLALEIRILNPSQGDAARGGANGGLCCGDDIEWKIQIMGRRVGRAPRQNRKSHRGLRQHLRNVVDGAVASTSEDGVATGSDGF